MAVEDVKAKLEGGEVYVAPYDFGDNLADAVDKFATPERSGEELVFAKFVAAARIDLQSFMRGLIKQEKSEDEILAAVAEWRPGMKARGKTPEEKIATILKRFSKEEARAVLEAALNQSDEDEDEEE